MRHLYNEVRKAEQELHSFLAGTLNEEAALSPAVRICAFHWYATTACNWVKMIAWIRQQHDIKAPTPDTYLTTIMPAVEIWRNKVSSTRQRCTARIRTPTRTSLLARFRLPCLKMAVLLLGFTG